MFSDLISWSTAAVGGAPFRFSKCTALGSAGKGAAAGGVSSITNLAYPPAWSAVTNVITVRGRVLAT